MFQSLLYSFGFPAVSRGLFLLSFVRFGSALSVLDFTTSDSSLSLRNLHTHRAHSVLGSSLSFGIYVHFDSLLRVHLIDFLLLGSLLSTQGLTAFRSTFTVFDFLGIVSSTSVGCYLRPEASGVVITAPPLSSFSSHYCAPPFCSGPLIVFSTAF